jgi:hypothetical protein
MPLTRLNDVSFSHNVLQRILGCGTLVVESAGERGQLRLDDVPKVEQVQRTLYRLSDDARGAGGRAVHPDDLDDDRDADRFDDERDDDTFDGDTLDGDALDDERRQRDERRARRTAVTERLDDPDRQ